MKLNDFLVHVFGTKKSVDEFKQLQEWKSAGELSAQKLKEMSDIHFATNSLSDYKSFDVEAALASTMEEINTPTKNSDKNYSYIGLIVFLVLALLSIFVWQNFYKTATTTQVFAENNQELYLKNDGSKFLVNMGSILMANEKDNHYTLEGEAFFDVEKQLKPVIIETNHGEITVLGTSFNIITNEQFTEVYMFDGTISFFSKSEKSSKKVTKGQCIIVKDNEVKIVQDLSDQVFSFWRTNTLKYENASLITVLEDLNKIFDKNINIEEKYKDIKVTTSFVNNSFDQIIDEIKVITGMSFE